MEEATPLRISPDAERVARYRVELLSWAEVGDHGVVYLAGNQRETLQWASILHAFAAEVGEPEGVRTVVFDLVVERKGDECMVCRFDADPGPAAQEIAIEVLTALGRGRCSRSLAELAGDGRPTRVYADLETLASDALAELGL